MIRQPTVFVLGAGASKPYGFPLGNEIKGIIHNQLSKNSTAHEQYQACGYSEDKIKEFRQVLTASPYETIDTILTLRPSLNNIGRFAIAMALAPCEHHDNLFPPKDWYKDLYHRLQLDAPQTRPPPLSIVTFNYDRSLEHYLHHTVKTAMEGDQLQSAKKKLANIPIIHVHGQLGQYPDVPYGFHEDMALVRKASEDIRIVSDPDLDESEGFASAFGIMNKAVNIIFLGFGYDARNLDRLRMKKLSGNRKIMGTAFQLNDRKKVDEYFGGVITFISTRHDISRAMKEGPIADLV